jgi:DNA-binding transcriptional ArsR family regulator
MNRIKSNPLKPTLWRTCRVLANTTRLRILQELCARPGQKVSDIAHRLKISLPVASQSLRALNARGLLIVRRVGPLVYYSPGANHSVSNSPRLLRAIQKMFIIDRNPCKNMFQCFTAFTHPRRIFLINILWKKPMQLQEIIGKSHISRRALGRHLRKLTSRGFLKCIEGTYFVCSVPRHRFARLILHLAKRS